MLICIVKFEPNSFHNIEKTRPAIEIAKDCFVPLSTQLGQGTILPKGEGGISRPAQIVVSQTQLIKPHQVIQELGFLSSEWSDRIESLVKKHFCIQDLNELYWQLPKA